MFVSHAAYLTLTSITSYTDFPPSFGVLGESASPTSAGGRSHGSEGEQGAAHVACSVTGTLEADLGVPPTYREGTEI
jgi:hypothetical protein